jgi:DNA-binding response OmpR family regulator
VSDRSTVSLLLIEDDASMARLIRHLLELDGYRRIRHVWSAEQAVGAAAEADIILLDHQLPDVRGMDLLPRLLGRPDPPSVIMVTGHGSESLAAAALRQGAEDYLTKDHTLPELLPRVLERVRRNRALRTALTEAERELVQAERLAAIGEMSVTLHHELNNPLMAAMAEVEMMLPTASAEQRVGLEIVRTALQRMAERLRQAADLRRADSTDYLGGLRMINLEQTAGGNGAYRGKALIYHPDQRVRRVISLLLRHAGFLVERYPSVAELQSSAAGPGLTLVLVPSGPEGGPPLSGFIPAAVRTFAVVVLGQEAEALSRAAGADHVLPMPFDPATLVGDILEAVANRNQANAVEDSRR